MPIVIRLPVWLPTIAMCGIAYVGARDEILMAEERSSLRMAQYLRSELSSLLSSYPAKLNTIASTVRGKRVILVDDSIVRGTTIARIVELLREAVAREVHVRLSAPPFLYPCYFGTDIDSRDNLIAAHHSVEEIARIIGVDSLGFLNVEHLPKLADHSTCGFCNGCFTGNYPVDPPRDTAKLKFERSLTERQKTEEGNL